MIKGKKVWIYTGGSIFTLLALLLVVSFVIKQQYRSKIPELSETQTLSKALQDQISTALDKSRNRPSADHLGALGMVYHSSANYEQAELCYELALKKKASSWIWNYYLGYLNMEMGRSENVIKYFNRVLDFEPDHRLAIYYLGEEHMNLGEYEKAEKLLLSILKKTQINKDQDAGARIDHFPIATYARYQLSRIYTDTDRIEEAEKSLVELIQTHRSFGPAYRMLGNIYEIQGNKESGQRYRSRASDLAILSSPVDPLVDKLVLMSRSDLYLLKKIDEAVNGIYPEWALRLIDVAISHMPENKFLLSKAIKISLWLDLREQAKSFTVRHIKTYQDSYSEMYDIGMSFYHDEMYTETIQYLSIALEQNPLETHIQEVLAISFWKMGDKPKSYFLLDKLLEKNPGNQEVVADVADILMFDFNDISAAIPLLNSLRRTDPLHPKVLKLSAGLSESRGNIREAIRLYDSSFSSAPLDITTIKKLGNLYVNQKMWGDAIDHYREALAFHSNDSYLLERLGTLLVTCPDSSVLNIGEGKQYAERAFFHNSSPAITKISAGRTLAYASAYTGDMQHAISVLNATITLAKREKFNPHRIKALESMLSQFQSSMN